MRANPFYFTKAWRQLRAAALERAGQTCEIDGCILPAAVVDHIETRPPVPQLCEQDRLDNLRCLCRQHDAQLKEQRRGDVTSRRASVRVVGCDDSGRSLDPNHQWNR